MTPTEAIAEAIRLIEESGYRAGQPGFRERIDAALEVLRAALQREGGAS